MKISQLACYTNWPFELDINRCYLPFTIEASCPSCLQVASVSLMEMYLSYPSLGQPYVIDFQCSGCNTAWKERVVMEVALSPAPEEEISS